MRAALVCAVPLLLSGCFSELDWRTVPGSQEQQITRAHWRTPEELWLVGTDPTLVRSDAGQWQGLDLCPETGWALSSLAFDEGGAVWAQCLARTAVDTYRLFRFAADRSVEEVPFPAGEKLLGLVQAGDTVRFLGAQKVWGREAEGWKELGTHPFRFPVGGIGEGPDDFYVDGEIQNAAPVTWRWNGQAFEKTQLSNATSGLALRGGKLFAGRSRLTGGEKVTAAEPEDAAGRNLRFSSALDEERFGHLSMVASTAFEQGTGGGVWLESGPGESLSFLGHAPFSTGNLYGGGGISFFYAVDESTFLVGVAGVGGRLVEGR